MIKVDIISGFLGAGKTTFIKELISKVYGDEKIVLIENEFGEIGIDSRFMQDAGIEVTEMNSGCICCTLVGDFARALKLVSEEYGPDRIVIEPSGVGKLSDVAKAVIGVEEDAGVGIEHLITVVDGKKAKMYMKNFGEFFNDQIEHAGSITILSGPYSSLTNFKALAKSPTRVQQMHPEFISVTSMPASCMKRLSMPISPNSFSISTIFSSP